MGLDFTFRSTDLELMDDLSVSYACLLETLKDINRANSLLGGKRITKNGVSKLIKAFPKSSYTVLDVGCGDGKMLLEVADLCKELQVDVRLIGIDINDNTLEIARDKTRHIPEIELSKQDILRLKSKDFECDILLCTLTLHHFNDDKIANLLKKLVQLAVVGIVINDLHRNFWAYHLFRLFSVFFIKSPMAKNDGLLSIKRGFLKNELLQYSKYLPSHEHSIKWRWAFRYSWILTKKST